MSRSPAHLRAVAAALRAMAGALAADVDGLVAHGDLSTWRGPAAERHRAGALVQLHRMDAVVAELRRLANALVNQADMAEDNAARLVHAHERRWREAPR